MSETPQPAIAPPADDTKIQLARADAAKQALEAENVRLQQMVMASRQQPIQQPQPQRQDPPTPDPLEKLISDEALLSPDEKRRLMDQGINRRVDTKVREVAQELERRNLAQLANSENRMALNNFAANNPDIANDVEGMGAAMTRAKIRAEAQGRQLSGPELLQFGVQIYRESHQPVAGQTVEGVSRADAGSPGTPAPNGAAAKPKDNWFEKKFGKVGPKDQLIEDDPDYNVFAERYIEAKHQTLGKIGYTTSIEQVLTQDEARRPDDRPSLAPMDM